MSTILSPFRKPTDLSNKGMFIFNFLGYIESNELKFSKELLDEEIKMLFIKTFGCKGEKNQRATIEEWIEALSNYKFKLEGGKRKRLNLMNGKKTNKKTSTDDKTEVTVVENINQEEPVKRKRGRPPKKSSVLPTIV